MNRRDVVLAVVAGLVAFVVYMITLAVGAFPGDFSVILTQSAGLFPRLTPGYPLWFGLAHLLRSLPVSDIAAPFNVASAAFGGIAVGLMCHVLNKMVLALVRTDEENEWHVRMAGRLAGAGAFCMPFWVVATRSHLAPFHVAYFLLATHVFLLAVTQHRRWAAILFGFLYGVGVVEDPTFVVFGLPFAVAYLVMLSRREALEPRQWWPPLAACLLGLGLYTLAAWQFLGSAGATLTDQHTFFGVLWSLWRSQWHFIAHSLPSQGWLVVVMVTILPAAIALLVSRRALNNEQDRTYYILHVVLTALAAMVALNFSNIPTPWRLLGYQRLLIMPYVLQAALFGYLLAYWYLLPAPWRIASGERRLVRRAVGPVLAVVGISLLVVSACRNFASADGRPSVLLRDFSTEIVRSLAGRTWLVTDGTLDASLLVEARRQGVDLRLINTAAEQNPFMQKYVAGQFQDARMRNLALLSTRALLNEWLEKKPEALNQVAFMTAAEILVGAGFQSVPNGALYLGRRESQEFDAAAPPPRSPALEARAGGWRPRGRSKHSADTCSIT